VGLGATAKNINAIGDAEFRSDRPAMRDSAPRVAEFALVFSSAP